MVNTISIEELNGVLAENSTGVVVVNFSAKYLGESRMMDSLLGELECEYREGVKLYSINADENVDFVASLGIHNLPTVMIYSNSDLVHLGSGLHSKSKLRKIIDQHNK